MSSIKTKCVLVINKKEPNKRHLITDFYRARFQCIT